MSVVLERSISSEESGSQAARTAVRPGPSLNELVTQFESAVKEKQDLKYRLGQALNEVATTKELYQRARVEFDGERRALNSEITSLRQQLESSKPSQKRNGENDGLQSVLAAREKLVRDEFERKFQELTIEVRRMRKKYANEVEDMKKQLSNCICNGEGLK